MTLHRRPFDEADLAMCDRSVTDPDFVIGPFEWVGFGASQRYRQRWHDDRLLGASPYNLIVAAADGSPVGWVNWRDTDRAGPHVWEIGVLIIPEMRDRGAGTAAHRLLVDYLFAMTPTHRIWAGTEVDNIAEQRALEHSGFLQEGLLRGHHFRDGQWRDSFIYGVTRDDYSPTVDDAASPSGNRKRTVS